MPLAPTEPQKGTAGNKNCKSRLEVQELLTLLRAFTRPIIPERLHIV
jgi:hypothetical protein